jgi:hypothetical protein
MTDDLPPLPKTNTVPRDYYTADQMHSYARTHAKAETAAARTLLAWALPYIDYNDTEGARSLASLIRAALAVRERNA